MRPAARSLRALAIPASRRRARFSRMPVVGLGECGIRAAALGGDASRLSRSERRCAEPILAKAASLELAGQLAEVLVLPFSIAEMVGDRDAARAEILARFGAVGMAPCSGRRPVRGHGAGDRAGERRIVLDGVEACIEALALP